MAKNGSYHDPFGEAQDPPEDTGLPADYTPPGEYAAPNENAVPVGSAKEVLDWVGDDKERAERAFDAEQEKSKPRVGLTNDLLDLLEK